MPCTVGKLVGLFQLAPNWHMATSSRCAPGRLNKYYTTGSPQEKAEDGCSWIPTPCPEKACASMRAMPHWKNSCPRRCPAGAA